MKAGTDVAARDYRISVEPHPDVADTSVVLQGLRAYNDAHLGPSERVPIAVFVRDADDRVCGGLVATVMFGWVHVDLLWLDEALRGRGLGTALMDAIEDDARRRGCAGAHLDTAEHQALPFYRKRGYEVFGVLEGWPVGGRTYYLRKDL